MLSSLPSDVTGPNINFLRIMEEMQKAFGESDDGTQQNEDTSDLSSDDEDHRESELGGNFTFFYVIFSSN